MSDSVNHPAHYGGEDNPYEVIKVIEAWGLDQDAYLFNVIKYVARPGKGKHLEDLKKARFYLERKILRLEAEDNDRKVNSVNTLAVKEAPAATYQFPTSTQVVCAGCVGTSGNHTCRDKASIPRVCTTCGTTSPTGHASYCKHGAPSYHGNAMLPGGNGKMTSNLTHHDTHRSSEVCNPRCKGWGH